MSENEKALKLNTMCIEGLIKTLNPVKRIMFFDKERNVLWKGIVKDTPEEIQNKYFYGYCFLTEAIVVNVK